MDNFEIEYPSQASFVRDLIRKDFPEFAEELIEQMWIEIKNKLRETDDEDAYTELELK